MTPARDKMFQVAPLLCHAQGFVTTVAGNGVNAYAGGQLSNTVTLAIG